MHLLLFAAIAGIWGSSFILMKKAAPVYGAITIGGLRLLGGLVILLLLKRVMGAAWRPRGHQWPLIAVVVVTGYAWPYCVQPFLIGRHDSGFIGMMVGFVPLLTILAQLPILRLRPSPREVLGVFGGLMCLWLVLQDGQDRAIGIGHLTLALSVPTCYAISNTLVKRVFSDAPAPALTRWCLLLATAAVLPVGILHDGMPNTAGPIVTATLAVAVLGVLGTGLAIAGLYHLVQARGPLWAGMVTYLIPLGAIAWGWLDGEAVTGLQLLALAGVLAMVALVQLRRTPRLPIAEPIRSDSGPGA